MREPLQFPTDPAWVRQAFAALDVIAEHGLQDELGAELRATMPKCRDEDAAWGSAWHHVMDLARAIPEEFGPRKQVEALAMEHVAGSRRKAWLTALKTVAALANRPQPAEPEEEPEPDPPGPPADWRPSYQVDEPVAIESAAFVPPAVRLAEARKAAGK